MTGKQKTQLQLEKAEEEAQTQMRTVLRI